MAPPRGIWHVVCYTTGTISENNHKNSIYIMTYEFSEKLSQIFTRSKDVAARHGASVVNDLCLMLAMLADESGISTQTLRRIGAPLTLLRTRIESEIRPDMSSDAAQTAPELDETCRRLMRMTALEARLAGVERAEEEHLLLAFLRDRANRPRAILNEDGVNYAKVASALNLRHEVSSNYGFADSEPDEYHADDEAGHAGKSVDTKGKPTSDTPIVDNFGIDLTSRAAEGGLDPVVGREKEIMRIAQILSRRKKNNPILIGQPGVGKSAIVEGLAQLIASRRASRSLIGKRIVALDMASIVAGTQYRGQFEERLRRLTQEMREHPEVILFIDEIHTIIGAGSAPGSLDAANILKPALARGEIQCIGATTTDEYRKSIEKDGALERRFQKIQLEPTTAEETLRILQNIKGRYEDHHNVTYTPEALEACVSLSEKYISDRSLPDKAIDALDEAGSRMHISVLSAPKEIEELEARIKAVKAEKQAAAKAQNYELAAKLRDESVGMEQQLAAMSEQWMQSQRENRKEVGYDEVAEVVSMMSGVPVRRVASDESERLRGLTDALSSKVIAQDTAIQKLVRAITRNRLGLKGPDRPVGTFLFVGPTGVGKTYLVKCLAEEMFGSKDALIRIDMSEYGEKYTTSRLVGAPPGYVGYDEGGQLTEKVRRHPYSVVLLDEIEKAHTDVFNMLLQVMDEGRMTDGNGVTVDFRNTIIVMTSNSGTRQLKDFGSGIGFSAASGKELDGTLAEGIVQKALKKQFAPEFLNRLDDIIMFQPLKEDDARKIAGLELTQLRERLEGMKLTLSVGEDVERLILSKGFDRQYGARSLKRAIQAYIEDPICDLMMQEGTTDFPDTRRVVVGMEGEKPVARFE